MTLAETWRPARMEQHDRKQRKHSGSKRQPGADTLPQQEQQCHQQPKRSAETDLGRPANKQKPAAQQAGQREQDHQHKLKSKKRRQQEQQGDAPPDSSAAAAETREEAHARRHARRARKAAKRQRKADKQQYEQQQREQQQQVSPAAQKGASAAEPGVDGSAEEQTAGGMGDGQQLLRAFAAYSRCLLGNTFCSARIEQGLALAQKHPDVVKLVQAMDKSSHPQQGIQSTQQQRQQRHSQQQQGQRVADAGGSVGEQGQAEAAGHDCSAEEAAGAGSGTAADASSRAGEPWTPAEDAKLLALVAGARRHGKRIDWAPIDLAMCRMPKNNAYKRHASVRRRFATLSWQAAKGASEPTAPGQQCRYYPTPMWRMIYEALQALPNSKGTLQAVCAKLAASQYQADLNWTPHHRWKDKPYWYVAAMKTLPSNSHFYATADKVQGKQVYAIDPNISLEKPKRSSSKGQRGYTAMGRNSRNMN